MNQPKGKKIRSIKYSNRRAVFSVLRRCESVSVGDAAREIGLSSTAVARIFASLQATGMIDAVGKGQSTNEGGKRPELFSLNLDYKYGMVLLADTNSIGCYIFDLRYHVRSSTTLHFGDVSYPEYMDLCARAVRETMDSMSVHPQKLFGCCIASPGIIDSDNGKIVFQVWSPGWEHNLPFCEDLRKRLDFDIDMILENNARLSAYIEYMKCAEEGIEGSFVALLNSDEINELTPGLGGVIINAGHVRRGVNGYAGEFGHIIVDYEARERCVCGRRGCLQAMTQPARIVRQALKMKEQYPDSSLWEKPQEALMIDDLFAAANKGDKAAKQAVDQMALYYARAIETIILTIDPSIVMVGGSFHNQGEYFLEELKKKLCAQGLFEAARKLRICVPENQTYKTLHISSAMYLFDHYLNDDETYHISEV